MNKLISTIAVGLTLVGCKSTEHNELIENIANQAERAQMNKVAFCENSKLHSYIETDYYYNWTCSDGSNFMLRKKQ